MRPRGGCVRASRKRIGHCAASRAAIRPVLGANGSLAAWIRRVARQQGGAREDREREAGVADYAKIFKAYDIRGLVPDELDEGVAEAVGAAFATLTGAPAVVTVHDMRTSSAPLAEAFARGVTSSGADVIAGGLGSTDMLYYASGQLGLPGAMLTASHNPAKYNGIKLCLAGAKPI